MCILVITVVFSIMKEKSKAWWLFGEHQNTKLAQVSGEAQSLTVRQEFLTAYIRAEASVLT